MRPTESTPGVLVIEDDQHSQGVGFEGKLFGATSTTDRIYASIKKGLDRGYGEAVFNTSMTGYQEILTDPSYYGQIVCMTTAHIGNTGINDEDPESKQPWCAGFVIQEQAKLASNWRSQGELNDYLKEQGIPGIYGVDTRRVTLFLRQKGVARALILPLEERQNAAELFQKLPPFEGRDLIKEVTTKRSYPWSLRESLRGAGNSGMGRHASPFRVVVMDFGVKWSLLNHLAMRGCQIEVVPAMTRAQTILDQKPDGIFLSNGPGDPMAATYAVQTIRELVKKVPVFGVCMGHQLLALSQNAKTYKLKFGHRGGNQPVLDETTGKVEISSHNHGYAVDINTLPSHLEATHINLNDQTLEGLRLKNSLEEAPAFSVQYHPEASPGPHDSVGLFDLFIDMMSVWSRKQSR